MIKNAHFLSNFLQTFHEWNPALLYHIYQHRRLPNYLSKNNDIQSSKLLIERCCIAWLDEPILYFDIDALEGETFFQQFMAWMNKVSNNKVLEYAHKIKNKSQPQENLLWFTEKSFQSLEGWLTNQFQKAITKNYYNKNNYDLDQYSKIQKLKSGLVSHWNSSYGCKKQLDTLLSMKISQTKNKNQTDFKEYQQKVKTYEDQYYEEVALLMDYQKGGDQAKINGEISKKKKKKSKKRNKKKAIQSVNETEADKNEEHQNEQDKDQIILPKQENIQQIEAQEISQMKQNLNDKKQESQAEVSIDEDLKNQNQGGGDLEVHIHKGEVGESRQNFEQCEQKQNRTVIRQQIQNEKSGNSDQWSNAQTNKTTKKSGQSHPEFNQIQRGRQIKNKRSLSRDESHNSISKLKRKNRDNRRHKMNAISSWNGDESINQNIVDSLEGNQFSANKQETNQKDQSEEPQIKQSEEAQKIQLSQKKKKKKSNKGPNLLKQLSNKVSSSLINRQLNNFIDSLSIETNNLYDHKIVSFERVRFFIQSLFPTSQAILFGSNAVGLSLPTSDIDIMLFNLPCSCREQAIEILAHLAVQINTMGWIVSCSTYLNAKVPLVKLQIDPTIQYVKTKRKCDYLMAPMLDPRILHHLQLKNGKKQAKTTQIQQKKHNTSQIIKVDLTVNITEEGILGGQSTQLMKQWMNRYPQIHMCILAFKYILAQRGFSSNFRGGIGSYCLFVMVSAYIREYPELQNLNDGDFFLSTLKFYGQQFQNQLKSIILRPIQQESINGGKGQKDERSCFITLQQTYQLLRNQMIMCYQTEDPALIYNIQTNPLRLFDPINNRIMSGSCHLYPQIKSQFRRIYKQMQTMKQIAEKEVQITVNSSEIPKMLQNKKTLDKWLNKYEARTRVSIKEIFDGGF